MSNIFQWQLHGDGKTLAPGEVVEPDERLTWVRTAGIGAQHVIAMFGATFLVPILTGFDPSTTLFFTAMSTALFLLINRNVLPSYLGSSFGFIAPITAVTTANKGIAVASFGIMVTGILLALVGVLRALRRLQMDRHHHAARGQRRDLWPSSASIWHLPCGPTSKPRPTPHWLPCWPCCSWLCCSRVCWAASIF